MTLQRTAATMLVALCAVFATACSSAADVTATQADDGGQVSLTRGQTLDIALADDYATSGIQWRERGATDDAVLRKLGSKYDPNGQGSFTSRYEGTGAGTARVTLVQEDGGSPPRVWKTFTVDVHVS